MVFSKDNMTGIILALLASVFIGSSFIIKKKGLRRAAVVSGVRAGMWGSLKFTSFHVLVTISVV